MFIIFLMCNQMAIASSRAFQLPTGMVDGRQGLKRNREMGPVHDPTIVGTHESKP
jgi:hypothetical protein